MYWGADEGIGTRCAGGCGGQVIVKGGNILRATAGQGGNRAVSRITPYLLYSVV